MSAAPIAWRVYDGEPGRGWIGAMINAVIEQSLRSGSVAMDPETLAVMNELRLDPAKVNPLGGAIALGHPLGATGAIRTATITHGMKRRKQKYGMVSMCIGTGMGAAGIFEAV